jgi:hypothetical protein
MEKNLLYELASRILRCADAAALATDTRVTRQVIGGYKNMISNLSGWRKRWR